MWTLLRKIVVFILVIMDRSKIADDNDNIVMKDKYIESHFDFKLDGNINGQEHNKQNDFAYAMYRDELKDRENCNPDINIEQKENQSNPHWTKVEDSNEKYLGLSRWSR